MGAEVFKDILVPWDEKFKYNLLPIHDSTGTSDSKNTLSMHLQNTTAYIVQ